MAKRKLPEGVSVRHLRGCPAHSGRRCSCTPTYQAQVWDPRKRRRVSRTFSDPREAGTWRQDATVAIRHGTLQAGGTPTLRTAADRWVDGARKGVVLNRSGEPYKPSAIRGYEQALRARILPRIGHKRLSDVRRGDVQDLVDVLLEQDLRANTIRNTLLPLRAIFRRAAARDQVAVNPTTGIELPAAGGRRERIASPAEAAELLAALDQDLAIWETAFYAGLRLGELRAFEERRADFDAGLLRVRWSWDPLEGKIRPKSKAGIRAVPMATILRRRLHQHRLDRLSRGLRGGLFFGRDKDVPFAPSTIYDRAYKAWARENDRRQEQGRPLLQPITLHEARHTFASYMIAAMSEAGRFNAKAIQTFMGHSSIEETFDRYGHLFPGSEEDAAGLLDGYLARASEARLW